MSNKITWKQFEYANEGRINDAFEDLTRVIFKIKYAGNISAELIAKNDVHPGFEADPINVGGKRLAFQSKYSNDSVYNAFLHSLKIAERRYKKQVDIIYLFTNRGLDSKCDGYKRILEAGKRIGAKIEFVNDKIILDMVSFEDCFKNVRFSFFNKLEIDDAWIEKEALNALKKQSNKYNKNGYHAITNDISHLLNYVFENNYRDALNLFINNVNASFNHLIKTTYLNKINRKFDNVLSSRIHEFIVNNISEDDCLKIFDKFTDIKIKLSKEIKKTSDYITANKDENNEKEQEYLLYLYNVNSVLSEIESSRQGFVRSSIIKTHIIEGDFGCGKTHLLKYVTDKRLNDNERTLLLYGESFVYSDSTIEEEIIKSLGLPLTSFDELLEVLESKGERDDKYTYIIIDAINECKNHRKWKVSLYNFIDKISSFKHIKLFLSLRSAYSKECLGDDLLTLESDNKLMVHKLNGLLRYGDEIPGFLKHYNITYSKISNEAIDAFTKPLLLTLYCKTNQNKNVNYIKNVDRISIVNEYIRYEEQRWENLEDDCEILQFNLVIKCIGQYLIKQYQKTIPINVLTKTLKDNGISPKNIKYMEKSDILEQIELDDGTKQIRFYYDAFLDKACSDALFSEDRGQCEFNIINFIDKDEKFRIIQSAISLILNRYKKTFGIEMDGLLLILFKKLGKEVFDSVFYEYLDCLLDDTDFDIRQVYSRYSNYLSSQRIYELIFERIIGSQNPNNFVLLDNMLFNLSLVLRDYYWTIYVNNQYEKYDSNLKRCIGIIFNKKRSEVEDNELILLSWLLTSTNRELRDHVSKEMVNILIAKPSSMLFVLNKYLKTNDPYVVSRILAAVYGAIAISQTIEKDTLESIASLVFNEVFDLDHAYEDIQVREYGRNIIETILNKNIPLKIDTNKCFPPYNSKNIPQLKVANIEKLYPENDYKNKVYYGTSYIASSLSPELKIGKLTRPYGDFGRYVFDSKLSDFVFKDENADRRKIFLYAYNYIVQVLGYNNDLFTTYDKEHYSYRSRKTATERIGKKYEWLALFHVMAKVTDNYKMNDRYGIGKKKTNFKGTWEPYLRDFDPTQLLINSNRFYSSNNSISISKYNNFDVGNHKWVERNKNSFKVEEAMVLKDSSGNEWIAIDTSCKDESDSIIEDKPYQSIWFRMKAYLIDKNDLKRISKTFIENKSNILNNILYENDNYQLFAYDYCWSSSYSNYYDDNNVVTITVPYTVHIKSTEEYKKSMNYQIILWDNKKINFSNNNDYHDETRYRIIAKIKRLSHSYLWEAEYDYSKEDTISYIVPSKVLTDMLGIYQHKSGVWCDNCGEIVAADFSLFIKSNVKGLYVRKDILMNKLPNQYMLLWIARCELMSIKKKYGSDNKRYLKNIMMYYDESSGDLKRINVND